MALSSDNAGAQPDGEVYHLAFPSAAYPHICYGLPFPQACAKHVNETFQASRVYVIASGSLSKNTQHVGHLKQALGERVVATRVGMTPHTLWSEILEIAEECRNVDADLIVTLGAGSLTDGAKIISLVRNVIIGPNHPRQAHVTLAGSRKRCEDIRRSRHFDHG
jgi:alcohol dehydrogenase class IV